MRYVYELKFREMLLLPFINNIWVIYVGSNIQGTLNMRIHIDFKQIVKGIDAVTREQLVQIMALLGIQNASPVFSMVPTLGPIKPAALLPTITEEDKVILNNVQKIADFLTAGSAISSNQVHLPFLP